MQSSDLVTLWKTAWERFKCHWGAGVAISFFNIPWVLILVWHRYLLIITPVFVLIFYVFLANYGLIAWNYSGSLSFRQYFPSLEAFFKVIMGFILFTLLAIAYSLDEIYSREDSTGRDNGNELYFGEDSTRATSQGKWYFQEDPMEAIGHGEWYVQEDSMGVGNQDEWYVQEGSMGVGNQDEWYVQEDSMGVGNQDEWYVQEDSMRSGSQSGAYSEENSIKESKKIDKNPLIFLFFFGPIFIIVLFFSYPFWVIDKEYGILQGVDSAYNLTQQHGWQVVLFFGSVIGINLLGALALGVGLLVTVPWTMIAMAGLYKSLTGEGSVEATHES